MTYLYPLKFEPIFKDKIWGGEKIKTFLGKDYGALPNCGETWELSGVKGNVSVVSNGPLKGKSINEVIQANGSQLLGDHVGKLYGQEFPLLIKFIDANQDLSIQVHPDDEIAEAKHDCKGKTEMWYVMQADEGSSLISGFNRELTRDEYVSQFEAGKLTDILNREEVTSGDTFFIPAGRVHTIGKGLLIAEIQQTSDITYRIYDFDRVDANGNKRELHVEEALDAIDYKKYPSYKTQYADVQNQRVDLASCEFFATHKLTLDKSFEVANWQDQSFKIYTCVGGEGEVKYGDEETVGIKAGEVLLIPAEMSQFEIVPKGEITVLESYIPNA